MRFASIRFAATCLVLLAILATSQFLSLLSAAHANLGSVVLYNFMFRATKGVLYVFLIIQCYRYFKLKHRQALYKVAALFTICVIAYTTQSFEAQITNEIFRYRLEHESAFKDCVKNAKVFNSGYKANICEALDISGSAVSTATFRYIIYDSSDQLDRANCPHSDVWRMLLERIPGHQSRPYEISKIVEGYFVVTFIYIDSALPAVERICE